MSAAEPASRTRWTTGVPVALLALHAALAWLARPVGLQGGDDARYLLLGRALRHLSYVELWRVDQPVHRVFPPVYPALLAAWSFVAGDGLESQAVFSVLLSVLTLATAYALTVRLLDRRIALASLAVLAVSPSLTSRAGTIASELPYALWTLLALWALVRQQTRAALVAAAGFAILAALTRSIGVTLVAAVLLTLLLQRRFAAAGAIGLAAGMTVGLWLLWSSLAPASMGASYVGQVLPEQFARHGPLGSLTLRLLRNVEFYPRAIVDVPMAFPNIPGTRVDSAVWLTLVCAGLVPGLVWAWRRWQPLALYLLLYGAGLLAWRWPLSRLLEPIGALLVPLWIWGLWELAGPLGPKRRLAVVAGSVAIVLGTSVARAVTAIVGRQHCGGGAPPAANTCLSRPQQDYLAVVRWMRDSTSADAAALAAKDAIFYYYTRRPTVSWYEAVGQPPAGFPQYLRSHGAQYIAFTRLTTEEHGSLATVLAASCSELGVAAAISPSAYVFRVKNPGDTTSADACDAVRRFQQAALDSAAATPASEP